MTRKTILIALAVVALALLDLTGFSGANVSGLARVHAQSGGGYDLTWSTLDGGGAMFSTGGGYSLGGTLGQPDAGAASSGGGLYPRRRILGWGGGPVPGVPAAGLAIVASSGAGRFRQFLLSRLFRYVPSAPDRARS